MVIEIHSQYIFRILQESDAGFNYVSRIKTNDPIEMPRQ
jgi:hypothetical protein